MTCTHGMPTPAACVDCMLDGPVSKREGWRLVGGAFSASFDGECPTCDGPIHVGQVIERYDRGDRTVYVHGRCSSPAEVRA